MRWYQRPPMPDDHIPWLWRWDGGVFIGLVVGVVMCYLCWVMP